MTRSTNQDLSELKHEYSRFRKKVIDKFHRFERRIKRLEQKAERSRPRGSRSNKLFPKDRYGTVIDIGNKVRILTDGPLNDEEAIVLSITSSRLKLEVTPNNSIWRAPKNVAVLQYDSSSYASRDEILDPGSFLGDPFPPSGYE